VAEVQLPQLGESVTEGVITSWLVEVGDHVDVDQAIVEISTDKVDTEIPTPVAGTVTELRFDVDDTVEVGQVLAVIDETADGEPDEDAPADDGKPADADADATARPTTHPRTATARPTTRTDGTKTHPLTTARPPTASPTPTTLTTDPTPTPATTSTHPTTPPTAPPRAPRQSDTRHLARAGRPAVPRPHRRGASPGARGTTRT
jgi:pyruvate dehydrogenase E2 component (dihydrolipoamide acetyltransferase)